MGRLGVQPKMIIVGPAKGRARVGDPNTTEEHDQYGQESERGS